MMALQYINAHNYININLPINLSCFMKSFVDFRNPAILFQSLRKSLDNSIFPPNNLIYIPINGYNKYDYGIDFTKNIF
jgi:hypothetical protein